MLPGLRGVPLFYSSHKTRTGNMAKVKLNVNGIDREVEVMDDQPLLWVLRDELKLVGTKFGCGVGQCGACTVHLNGSPVRSCSSRAGPWVPPAR